MLNLGKNIRRSTAMVIRNLPAIRGRSRIASMVNRTFPPDPSQAKVCAPMRLKYEMLVDLRSLTEYLAYYTSDYDTTSIRSLLRTFGPDWTVLDVGANIGFWTIPMASVLREGGILHAFEPIPSNFSRLAQNVSRNGLDRVVNLHEHGLSDQSAELPISLREDFAAGSETGNAAIVIDQDDYRFETATIKVAPLDDLLGSLALKRLDFVKVDIEGHEDQFLRGATQTILRYRPMIYMEINNPYYSRRGLDATSVFEGLQSEFSYEAVFYHPLHGWQFQKIAQRKREIDNVLLLPAENRESLIARLRQ